MLTKRKDINSGQYYAEEAMLKRLTSVLMKYRKVGLQPEQITYTMDLISVEPAMTYNEISTAESLSQIKSFADVKFTQKQGLLLEMKRPKHALPLWVYGVYYIWSAISLIIFWNYYEIQIIDFLISILFKIGVISLEL